MVRSFLLGLTLSLLTSAGTVEAGPRQPAERTLWYRSIVVAEGLSQGFVSARAHVNVSAEETSRSSVSITSGPSNCQSPDGLSTGSCFSLA